MNIRIVVKAIEYIDEYKDTITTLSDSLSILLSVKADTVKVFAKLGTLSLYFKLRDIFITI